MSNMTYTPTTLAEATAQTAAAVSANTPVSGMWQRMTGMGRDMVSGAKKKGTSFMATLGGLLSDIGAVFGPKVAPVFVGNDENTVG